MTATPKTIQIFLPHGDPQGIRIAEVTIGVVRLFDIPRSLLQAFATLPESGDTGPALYFLVGQTLDEQNPQLYVGQTGDIRGRLTSHNKEKDWWQRALVLVALTKNVTQTHTLFLEWHAIQKAKEAGRYDLKNGNAGSRPHIPSPLEADCFAIFESGRTLLGTLGFPIFDALVEVHAEAPAEVFLLSSSGATGRMLYTPEGFVVLAGSVGRRANVDSMMGTSDERFRLKLVEAGVMVAQGDTVVFQKDHLFNSPSMAAVALLGRTANGWDIWKRADGKTLHELKRATPVGAA